MKFFRFFKLLGSSLWWLTKEIWKWIWAAMAVVGVGQIVCAILGYITIKLGFFNTFPAPSSFFECLLVYGLIGFITLTQIAVVVALIITACSIIAKLYELWKRA